MHKFDLIQFLEFFKGKNIKMDDEFYSDSLTIIEIGILFLRIILMKMKILIYIGRSKTEACFMITFDCL